MSCQLHASYPSVFNIARAARGDATKAIRSARYAAIKVTRNYSRLIGSQPQTFVRLVPKGRGPSNSASTRRRLARSLARCGINAGSSLPSLERHMKFHGEWMCLPADLRAIDHVHLPWRLISPWAKPRIRRYKWRICHGFWLTTGVPG